MLCNCFSYTKEDILELIDDYDFKTIEDIRSATLIGSGCGRCLNIIETIFYNKASGDGNNNELSP